MASVINIRFRRKDIAAAVSNIVFIVIGLVMFQLALTRGEGFVIIGLIFTGVGIYPFSKSKGVLVDSEKKELYPYTAALWIKSKTKLSFTNFESILVTTGTEIHKGGVGTLLNRRRTVSFMVYKIFLMPNPYMKTEKVWLGDFYTKAECMIAAEELTEVTSLPLNIKVR